MALRKRGKAWYAYWREDGKVLQRSLGTDVKIAKKKMLEIEERLAAQRNGAQQEIAWAAFVEKYLDCCRANNAKATVVRQKVVFNNFNKAIPLKRLSDLTPQVLEEFKLIRKNDGVQPSTINREITTFKSAMKKAAEWGYTSANIWGVRKLPTVKKRPVFFMEEEILTLLRASDPFWKLVVYIGFYAGLRRGEMLNLGWTDIDFQRKLIRITPNTEWHPKDYEAREIPLYPVLEEYLLLWKKLCPGTDKVVPWSQPPLYLTLRFTKLLKRSGINKGSLHSLRHSFASNLAMRGVDLYRVGKMMGHSSVVTTQIYAHLLPSSLKDAISVLPAIRLEETKPEPPHKNGQSKIAPPVIALTPESSSATGDLPIKQFALN